MRKFIEKLDVRHFRGLKDLSLKGLGRINVLLGDNNSGKTSLLEAIQFFRNPSFGNILRICNQRTPKGGFLSLFTDFLYAFPQDSPKLWMALSCVFDSGQRIGIDLQGKIDEVLAKQYLFEKGEREKELLLDAFHFREGKTVRQFFGSLVTEVDDKGEKEDISSSTMDVLVNP